MTIIEPSVELIEEKDIYKKIEMAGRMCYKSEDKIADGSYERFIKSLIHRGHYSVLEHASISICADIPLHGKNIPKNITNQFYSFNDGPVRVITANIRAWRELMEIPILGFSPLLMFLKKTYPLFFSDLVWDEEYMFDLEFDFDLYSNTPNSIENSIRTLRESFVLTGDRAFSHQMVRNRLLSVSQESQRYCNYSYGKFGGVKFIMPEFVKENKLMRFFWEEERGREEREYFFYLANKVAPEEARNCLPNCTATSMFVTADLWEWKHIFGLRIDPHAQEQIRNLMITAKEMLLKKYEGTKEGDFLNSK